MEYKCLEELATIVMGQSPKKEEVNLISKGLPLLNGPTEFGNSYPTPVQYTEHPKKIAPKGSLLFCVRGSTTGRMNWADQDYAIGRGLAAIIPLDGRMGEYIKQSIEVNKNYLLSSATGSTFPNVSAKLLASTPLTVGEHTIGTSKFLSDLKDKIDINLGVVSNLENLARILYKHWFLDFEFPDAEGRPYKSSGGKMVDSELGEIPEGWEITSLKQVATYSNASFNPQTTDIEEVNHFSMPAFDEKAYPIIDKVSEIKSNKYMLEELSVLFSKMNPITPRIWLPNIDNELLNVCSTEFVVLNNPDTFTRSFVYEICKSNTFNNYLVSNAAGSTNSRQRVRPAVAIDYKFAYQEEISKEFGEAVVPIHNKILVLREENAQLTELRDTLLPKVLSGEIELPQDGEVTMREPV